MCLSGYLGILIYSKNSFVVLRGAPPPPQPPEKALPLHPTGRAAPPWTLMSLPTNNIIYSNNISLGTRFRYINDRVHIGDKSPILPPRYIMYYFSRDFVNVDYNNCRLLYQISLNLNIVTFIVPVLNSFHKLHIIIMRIFPFSIILGNVKTKRQIAINLKNQK